MANEKNSLTKDIGQGAALRRLVKHALLTVVTGVALLVLTILVSVISSNVQSEQLNATKALNQYRNGYRQQNLL